MRNEFYFKATCKLTMSNEVGVPTSKHVATDFRLDVSPNLQQDVYLQNDLPTKEAIKPMTQCFIQGLVGNIHFAHEKGWWDSAEHLRYIIKELERGFVEVAKVSDGIM
jgi:hypothetical protein